MGFTAVLSNNDSEVAVANDEGDIRLFKGVGQKKAKNLYAGDGEKIYSLDTTKDGNWLLGTCRN